MDQCALSCKVQSRFNLHFDRRVPLGLQGGLQALLFHASLQARQDGLYLPGPFCQASPHSPQLVCPSLHACIRPHHSEKLTKDGIQSLYSVHIQEQHQN